jgi:hypothetical protein
MSHNSFIYNDLHQELSGAEHPAFRMLREFSMKFRKRLCLNGLSLIAVALPAKLSARTFCTFERELSSTQRIDHLTA